MSKKQLAVFLSKLKVFDKPNVKMEQYSIDSEIAADVLWNAKLKGDITGKIIADFGCGTGILGIGALKLGANKVIFVEKDGEAIEILEENLEVIEKKYVEIIPSDISEVNIKSDVIIQNPPFGAKRENRNADRLFLEKAFQSANVVYSFHKVESKRFIEKFSKENGFMITDFWEYDWPLKRTLEWHKKKMKRIGVGCWRMERH